MIREVLLYKVDAATGDLPLNQEWRIRSLRGWPTRERALRSAYRVFQRDNPTESLACWSVKELIERD